MKKILFVLLLISGFAYGQEPTPTPMKAHYRFFQPITLDTGLYIKGFADTTAANSHWLSDVAGGMIRTGNDFWMRNVGTTAWLQFVNVGTGTFIDTTFWKTGGNSFSFGTSLIGTTSNTDIRFASNNVTRFILRKGGPLDFFSDGSDGYDYIKIKNTAGSEDSIKITASDDGINNISGYSGGNRRFAISSDGVIIGSGIFVSSGADIDNDPANQVVSIATTGRQDTLPDASGVIALESYVNAQIASAVTPSPDLINGTATADVVSEMDEHTLTINKNNSDFVTPLDSSHVILSNPHPAGINSLTHVIDGNVVSKWRGDFDGNNNFVSTGSGKHFFFTGGDFGVGDISLQIEASGITAPSLISVGSAPTTSGTLASVVSDENGKLSFRTLPLQLTQVITQAGAAEPSIDFEYNTTGDTYIWAYVNPGEYTLTATGSPFSTDKTTVVFSLGATTGGNDVSCHYQIISDQVIKFWTLDAGLPDDDVLDHTTIEIKIYP